MRSAIAAIFAVGIAAAFGLATERTVAAHPSPCDFLTGGGFINTTASGQHALAKANFGIGGGCKDGSPTWGHLNYEDHGNGLHVHWLTITGYMQEGDGVGDTGTDPKTGQPTGTRLICGTARTNQIGDVDFMVRARDRGEPGRDDEFDIRLSQNGIIVYTTEVEPSTPHKLNDSEGGGGNIQLHKPNPSTAGEMGGLCAARAAV